MVSLTPYNTSAPILMGYPDPCVDYFAVLRDYSYKRLEGLARRVIYSSQRIPATGIFEGETGRPLRTFWDEFCFYIQKYDNDCGLLSYGFDATLDGMITSIVEDISNEEAVLISCAVCEYQEHMPARDDKEICDVVRTVLNEAAGWRSLEKFELY